MNRHSSFNRLALIAAGLSVVGVFAADVFAHGTVVDSRVYRVRKTGEAANLMGAWTSAMYDWAADSNTFADYSAAGFEYSWHVPDGTIASAGKNNGTNGTLDFSKVNTPGAWPTTATNAGASLAQKWVAPAPHDPSYFDVWITKPGFDVTTQTMGWSNLDKLGRWEKNTSLNVTTTPNGGTSPADNGLLTSYDWNVNIPANRSGRAALVVVWQRRDPVGEAFFSVQDVMIAGSGPTWNLTTGGAYTTASNWTTNAIPSGVGSSVTFGNKITAPATIQLNATSPTLGTITFNSAQPYTIASNAGAMLMTQGATGTDALIDVQAGSHTLDSGLMLMGNTKAAVASGSQLTINGMLMFSSGNLFTKSGAGTLKINPSTTMGASNAAFVNESGKLQIDKPLSPSISIYTSNGAETRFTSSNSIGYFTTSTAGTKVVIDSSSAAPLVLKAVGIGVGSNTTIDLGDNALLLDYTGAGNSPYEQVKFYTKLGITGGHLLPGIVSSAAATNAKMTIGVAEASAIGSPTTFMGTSIDATTVIARYTLKGDANLSGNVNFDDLIKLAQGYNKAGEWVNGDFNYDGTVNFDDLIPLAQNYNQTVPGSVLTSIGGASFAADFALAQSLVPEPTTISGLVLAASMMMRRRR